MKHMGEVIYEVIYKKLSGCEKEEWDWRDMVWEAKIKSTPRVTATPRKMKCDYSFGGSDDKRYEYYMDIAKMYYTNASDF